MLKHKSFILFKQKKQQNNKNLKRSLKKQNNVIAGHYDHDEAISLSFIDESFGSEDGYDDAYQMEQSFDYDEDNFSEESSISLDDYSESYTVVEEFEEDAETNYSDANKFFEKELIDSATKHKIPDTISSEDFKDLKPQKKHISPEEHFDLKETSAKKKHFISDEDKESLFNELSVLDELDKTTDDDKKFAEDIKAIMSGKKVFDKDNLKKNPTEANKYKNHGLREKGVKDVAEKMKAEHAIFDQIAQSMDMANTYDLGTIAMDKRFDEIEEETKDEFAEKIEKIISKDKKTNKTIREVEIIDKKDILTKDFLEDIDSINKEKYEKQKSVVPVDSHSLSDEESNCRDTWDKVTNRRIELLHPAVKCKAKQFINEVEDTLGIQLRVTSSYRSFDEQTALYNQGRTASGKIVTNAKAGQSYHNYGVAIDVCEIKGGKALWDDAMFKKIAPIGINLGFEWGGNWKKFVDKPHFQFTKGKSTSELLKSYQEHLNDYTKIPL